MTITNTAQSFAHEAANAASDLANTIGPKAAELANTIGPKAAEFGSKAAEIGSDAASSVAAAATNLAHVIGKKVPAVQPKRKAAPWRLILLVGVGVGGALAFMKGRRRSTVVTSSREFVPAATKPTADAAETPKGEPVAKNGSPSTNGKKSDDTVGENATH